MRTGDLLVNTPSGYVELRCDGKWNAIDFIDARGMLFICLGETFVDSVSLVWVLASRGGVTRISKGDLKVA